MFKFIVTCALLEFCSAFKHLGCYSSDNTMYKLQDIQMTPKMCYEHCDDLGMTHMYLSKGDTCGCGNNMNNPTWVPGCETPCAGADNSTKFTCGGEKSSDVFEMSRPHSPISEEYLDCFADCADDRVMKHMTVIDKLTWELCREYCVSIPGSMYYATQYSNECFCGTSDIFRDYDRHGRGVCHIECEGDHLVSCGGLNSFDLFKISDCESSKNETSNSNETESGEHEKEKPEMESGKPEMESGEHEMESSETEKPSETESGKMESSEQEIEFLPQSGRFGDLLDIHNSERCKHGAEPLVYSEQVSSSAQKYADKLASENCGQLVHSQGSGYGENLYLCGSSKMNCYSASDAMNGWYDEEVDDGPVTNWGGHATQCLWKSTKELGCGISSCNGGYNYDILVCQYNPPGNYMNNLENEVGKLENGNC